MDLLQSAAFDTHIAKLMEEWHVPGLTIALVQDQTTASKAFGHASLHPPKPCTPDSLFDVASCSKSMTAAAVAALVVDNERFPQVQWTSTMSDLLREDFTMSDAEHTRSVTVEDVLSHRSGLPSHDWSYFGIRAQRPDTARSITLNLRNLPISAPHRTKYQYCNLMYTIATHLIETVTLSSFETFLRTKFFTPLDMHSTHLQPESSKAAGLAERMAFGHVWNEETSSYKAIEAVQSPEAQGAGSIITSVNDYINYIKAVMNQEGPITRDMYEGLIQPRISIEEDGDEPLPFTSEQAYAAGWEVCQYRGHPLVTHDGNFGGFGSTHFYLPTQKFGGVILGNAVSATELAGLVARELIDEALKVPVPDRPDWNAIFMQRSARWEKEDDEAEDQIRIKLCPDLNACPPQAQILPIVKYTGEYWNIGYGSLVIGTRDARLFVDAADRSMGFSLAFDHLCGQTKYVAHLSDVNEDDDVPIAAEFRFENELVVQLGLRLEADLDEMIWFDRVHAGPK